MLTSIFLSLVAACGALVLTQPSHHATQPVVRSPALLMGAKRATKNTGPVKYSGFKSAEEERRQKLEVGANWQPRTSTVKGEGYQFFQGPTPKTGTQDNLPSFFDLGETTAGVQDLSLFQAAAIGIAVLGSLAFLVTVLAA